MSNLSSAKYSLEKAVDLVTHFILNDKVLEAKHRNGNGCGFKNPAVTDAHYFHSTAANVKGFEKVVAGMIGAEPTLSNNGAFHTMLMNARNLYTSAAAMVVEEKARLAAKREAIATRKQNTEALGIDLKKHDERATPETYLKVLAELEPIRLMLVQKFIKNLNARAKYLRNEIGTDYRKNFTYNGRVTLPDDFSFFFNRDNAFGIVDVPNLTKRIADKAEMDATNNVQSFAAKLAGKIDRERSALSDIETVSASTADLWNHSTTTVKLDNGTTQVWSTQIIVNYSCLGNAFNQWPTRRVS